MPYQYENLLRTKAQAFVDEIQSQLSYDAKIDPDSLREYSIDVRLGDVSGKAVVYYSPKKKTYKFVPQGIDKAVAETVTTVWDNMPGTTPATKKEAPSKPETDYQAYVDGSHHKQKDTVGYGAIILQGDKELIRLSGRVDKYIESRQIGGELKATMAVVNWCQQNDIPAIDIYYDYKGIELWATGRWKTEKAVSQDYRAFMQKSKVKIHWHKVKSHTGVHWNEVADELAKKGTLS